MKKTLIITITLVLTLFTVLAMGACAPAAPEERVILIGDHEPLTGAGAAWALAGHRGVELAVEVLNEEGGIKIGGKTYTFRTVVYDNKYTSEGGVACANKLVFDDKCKFVVMNGSTPSISAGKILNDNEVINVSLGHSQAVLSADKPWSFRAALTSIELLGAFYKYVVENHPEVKTVAIVTAGDDAGVNAAVGTQMACEQLGLKIVAEEYYDRGATDFYPFLTKAMAAKPDLIDIAGASLEEGPLIKQLNELGYTGVTMGPGHSPKEVIDVAGIAAMEGHYFTQPPLDYDSPMASPMQKAFADRYKSRYVEEAIPQQAERMYETIMGLVETIEKADTLDVTVIRDAWEQASWELLSGEMSQWGGEQRYGIKHQLAFPALISQVQNGRVIHVAIMTPDIP